MRRRKITARLHFSGAGTADITMFMVHDCDPVRKWRVFSMGINEGGVYTR